MLWEPLAELAQLDSDFDELSKLSMLYRKFVQSTSLDNIFYYYPQVWISITSVDVIFHPLAWMSTMTGHDAHNSQI